MSADPYSAIVWEDDTIVATTEPTTDVTIVATLSLPLFLEYVQALTDGLEVAYGVDLLIRRTGDVIEVIRR